MDDIRTIAKAALANLGEQNRFKKIYRAKHVLS